MTMPVAPRKPPKFEASVTARGGHVHWARDAKEAREIEDELADIATRIRAQAGRDRIAGNLDRAVAKGKLDQAARDAILARVATTDEIGAARDADLVVEAVFEDVDVKQGRVVRHEPVPLRGLRVTKKQHRERTELKTDDDRVVVLVRVIHRIHR